MNADNQLLFVIASYKYAARVATAVLASPDFYLLDLNQPLKWLTITDIGPWSVIPWQPVINKQHLTRAKYGLVGFSRTMENVPALAWALCQQKELLAWQVQRFAKQHGVPDGKVLLEKLLMFQLLQSILSLKRELLTYCAKLV